MYCNSCLKQIAKDEGTFCQQCGVPIHKSCANHCLVCGVDLCDSCYAENGYRCEECFSPEKMFSIIRRSHIEQYASCPYSLYLQLVLGIVPPMGKHAQLGVIVHELVDRMSSNLINLTQAKLELERTVEEWNLSTEDRYSIIPDDLLENGMICLDNFELIRGEFSSEYKSEYNIKFSLDDDLPSISCTLDRISFEDDKLFVHDWKTGKPMSGKKLVTDLQPPLYMYAVYKEFGTMPDSFTLHYLQPNKHITYKKKEDMIYEVTTSKNVYTLDVNEALERTKEILKGIKNNQFNMPDDKTHAWKCANFCWYGISGKCSGVQSEQWAALNKQYAEEKTA